MAHVWYFDDNNYWILLIDKNTNEVETHTKNFIMLVKLQKKCLDIIIDKF